MANIQRIRSLLNMIDTQTVADRQMKAFTLLHASGAVVADLINRTFGCGHGSQAHPVQCRERNNSIPSRPIRTTMSPPFTTTPPGRSSSSARANASHWPKQLIAKFEDKEGGGGGDVRIYFPQVTKRKTWRR